MNKNIIIKISLILAIISGACSDYLDQYPYGNYTDEENWQNQAFVQGLVGQCYDYMPRDYNDNEGYYLDGATDDAVITSPTHSMNLLAKGSLVTGSDPFAGYWQDDYRAIALTNLFLKDNRGFKTKFIINDVNDSLVRYRLQGEAFALRAWFQWDLLKKFGGEGMNGELLGFPIILEPIFQYAHDLNLQLNVPRNTYEECVKQIQADCDSALKYLPMAHRDFLSTAAGLGTTYAGGLYWGRMDGVTVKALLADMYLTYASPLFNRTNDMTRWEKAASYAKQVIDFKLTVDGARSDGFKTANPVDWVNPNFPGIVYSSRVSGGSSSSTNVNSDAMERALFPSGFQGNGVLGATQDLVDAFPMKNGYPITDPRSGYDPKNPYKDRDPRFYSIIYYNGAQIKKDNTGTLWYTFENWENTVDAIQPGKDAAGKRNVSLTNYHVKKFLSRKLNYSDVNRVTQPHSKFFYRWAHMVLTYAEAINQLDGPTNGARFGLTAKDAMRYLRTRKTYDNATLYTNVDPYLDEVANGGKEVFGEFVKNERRIETCFEGMRFFDLRRWNTTLDALNKPVHKAVITLNADGTFTYGTAVVANRVYNSLYLPIPYTEILKMDKLVQNKGWESWSR